MILSLIFKFLNLDKKKTTIIFMFMKIVKGKYANGVVKLEKEELNIKGEVDVYVLFPEEIKIKRVKVDEFLKAFSGKIEIGGDAVKESEDIYE